MASARSWKFKYVPREIMFRTMGLETHQTIKIVLNQNCECYGSELPLAVSDSAGVGGKRYCCFRCSF